MLKPVRNSTLNLQLLVCFELVRTIAFRKGRLLSRRRLYYNLSLVLQWIRSLLLTNS